MPITSRIQPITIPPTGTPTPPPSAPLDHYSGPWLTTKILALCTDELHLDPILHKLSTFGQIDDVKAWATDESPSYQVYSIITFRYVSDLQKAIRPLWNAQTKILLSQELHRPEQTPLQNEQLTQSEPTNNPNLTRQEIGVLQHHCHSELPLAPESEGTTRSVVFFDSRGNTVRLTPKFQNKVEKAWERVRENIYADSGPDQDGNSPLAGAVPEPWRGKWWIIYPAFDLRRNRATFESVDVARRVIKKMKREVWGGEWDVTEGRYVSDPVPMEELADGHGDPTDRTDDDPELDLVRL